MIRVAGLSLIVVTTTLNAGLNALIVLSIRYLFISVKDLLKFTAIIESGCSAEGDKTSLLTKAIID